MAIIRLYILASRVYTICNYIVFKDEISIILIHSKPYKLL